MSRIVSDSRPLTWVAAGLAVGTSVPAAAQSTVQSTAPSSITPGTLRPPPSSSEATVIPQTERLVPPAGSEKLTVRLSTLEVEGGFPEVADETGAIAAKLAGRTVTLADIYAAASAIEAAHARAGYILARVTVPPQTLAPDRPVRILVVDGYFDSIDASGVPTRVRAAVLRRVVSLKGRRHLTLAEIEQPLVIAGDVPGLTLTSTLARGTEIGGARLILAGRQRLVSGSVSAGNYFSPLLGRWGFTAQLSVNSPLGLGEQFYGFATSGYDLSRTFASDVPVRVLGGGLVLPSGDGRAFINPEATFSRTQPFAQPGVPRTRGRLQRFSLRGGYTLRKTRRQSLSLGATIEHVEEANDAIDFDTGLSLDRLTVGRIQATWSSAFLRGGGTVATAEISQGLGGRDVRDQAANANVVPGSRQGAGPDFTKLDASWRLLKPVPHGIQLSLIARGQTSFGRPLLRSEQSQLEGADALSAYVGGITAVDESLTGRVEVAHALTPPTGLRRLTLLPYVFGAAGQGWIDRPSAIEAPTLTLGSAGAGVHASVPRIGIGLDLEYAHGFSGRTGYNGANRVAVTLSKSF